MISKALSEYRISGVTTNIDFLYNLVTSSPFVKADIDTSFIEKNKSLIFHDNEQALAGELPMAALYLVLSQTNKAEQSAIQSADPYSPWHNTSAWRLNEAHIHHLTLAHKDVEYPIIVEQKRQGTGSYYLITIDRQTGDRQGRIDNDTLYVSIDGYRSHATIAHHKNQISLYHQSGAFNFTHILPDCGNNADDDNHGGLTAPMNGTIVSILVKAGDIVIKDQSLIIMEAMKMEHTIKAPSNGTIETLFYADGDMVTGGSELLAFIAEEA